MMRLAYNDRRIAALRPETGFAFLAPLLPFLATAAEWVVGQVASVALFVGITEAMSPRSDEEQARALEGAIAETENLTSVALWLAKTQSLRAQLDTLSGERAYEARGIVTRLTDFIGRRVSDIEREAAFTAARLRIADLARQEAATTGPRGTTPAPVTPSASGGGRSSAGTLLVVGGVVLAAGLAWGMTRGGRR